ncbi:hypothetical protein GN956_G14549 [Arapaima gigas]
MNPCVPSPRCIGTRTLPVRWGAGSKATQWTLYLVDPSESSAFTALSRSSARLPKSHTQMEGTGPSHPAFSPIFFTFKLLRFVSS